jgi:uncharacterized LabA/DUF88 family protein
MKKTNLYIDGTNLFIGLIDLFGVNDIPSFKSILKNINKIIKIDHIFFYASYTLPTNKKYKDTLVVEAKFYKQVIETPNLIFYKGHRSPTSGKEKGVDVHLAIDITKDAFQKKYNQAVIMSGDADFVYAVEIVRFLNIPIHALFIPNRFSRGIAHTANHATILNYKNQFVPQHPENLPKHLEILKIKPPHASTRGRLS